MEVIQWKEDRKDIILAKTIEKLKEGGLIIYPTETCYGMGGDATNPQAVEKVLQYKTKRADKPLSIAVADIQMAEKYVVVNESAQNIYKNFLPGPITVVSQGKNLVAPGVQSPRGTLGIRIPDFPFVLSLVKTFGKPITATSANASYKKTPYSYEDIWENISERQKKLVSLMIDFGTLPKRKPSVVVDTTLEDIRVLRKGEIDLQKYRDKIVENEREMNLFAQEIFQKIKSFLGQKNIIILLQGELGTGKTFFTRSLGEFLGVEEVIVSPTFILCREYSLKNWPQSTLYHIDTYRMFSPEEMETLPCKEMFVAPNMVIIEWADRVEKHIQKWIKNALIVKIRISHLKDTKRHIFYRL